MKSASISHWKKTVSTVAVVAMMAATGAFVVEAFTAQPAVAAQGEKGAGKGQAGGGGGNGQTGGGSGNPQAPQGSGSGQAGAKRPNWADQENMVDIGRLNILKANPRVLNHAVYEERLADYTLYTKSVSTFVSSLTSLDQIVDSPVANMGILNSYWKEVASGTYDGFIDYSYVTNEDGAQTTVSGTIALTPASFTDLSAILIGIAIDKEVTPTAAIVDSLATIVWGEETADNPWPDEYNAAAIAAAAALVQDKVVEVHNQ